MLEHILFRVGFAIGVVGGVVDDFLMPLRDGVEQGFFSTFHIGEGDELEENHEQG